MLLNSSGTSSIQWEPGRSHNSSIKTISKRLISRLSKRYQRVGALWCWDSILLSLVNLWKAHFIKIKWRKDPSFVGTLTLWMKFTLRTKSTSKENLRTKRQIKVPQTSHRWLKEGQLIPSLRVVPARRDPNFTSKSVVSVLRPPSQRLWTSHKITSSIIIKPLWVQTRKGPIWDIQGQLLVSGPLQRIEYYLNMKSMKRKNLLFLLLRLRDRAQTAATRLTDPRKSL